MAFRIVSYAGVRIYGQCLWLLYGLIEVKVRSSSADVAPADIRRRRASAICTACFVVWRPRRAADTSTNRRQGFLYRRTASMEHAADTAEAAAVDQYFLGISRPQRGSTIAKVGKLTRANMSLTLSCKLAEVFAMICVVLLKSQAQDSVVL